MEKRFCLLLILLFVASSLIVVNIAVASTPKPSVPEFTVEFVAYPYYVPANTTTSIDPYTGEEIMHTQPGYQVQNESIEITIKNQVFTPCEYSDGNYSSLYYDVRFKGHYADDWPYTHEQRYYGYYRASDSDYTILSLNLTSYGLWAVPSSGMVDIQLEALIGNENLIPTMTKWGEGFVYEFSGEKSGWSSTQTIEIQRTEPFPTTLVIAITVTVVIIGVGSLFFFKIGKGNA